MGTHTITVPPQTGPMPARHEVVDPLCGVLLDAVEAFHKSGSDEMWTATRCTEQERETLLLATRYVTQMMGAFGLWDLSNPSSEVAPAGDPGSSIVYVLSKVGDIVGEVLSNGDLDESSRQHLAALYRIASEVTAKHGEST